MADISGGLEGAMRGLAAALRGYTAGKVAVAQAKNDRERQQAQISLQEQALRLQEERNRIEEMLGSEQIESQERIATQAQEEATRRQEMELAQREKENVRALRADIQKMKSQENLTREEIQARLKAAEMASDTEINKALILEFGATERAQLGAQTQKDVAQIGATAQTDAAKIQQETAIKVQELENKRLELMQKIKEKSPSVTSVDPGQTLFVIGQDGEVLNQVTVPGVPGVSGRPKTVDERKMKIFASRMEQSLSIIEQLESDPKLRNQLTAPVTGALGRSMPDRFKGPQLRQYNQAKLDFINAVIRQESGAVITDDEIRKAEIQYFPQPGDDEQTIANKAELRRIVLRQFQEAAGMVSEQSIGRGNDEGRVLTAQQREDLVSRIGSLRQQGIPDAQIRSDLQQYYDAATVDALMQDAVKADEGFSLGTEMR